MAIFNCDKCNEGTLEFEVQDADTGDGVWFQSFTVVQLVGRTCRCAYTETEMRKLEDAAIEAEEYDEIEGQVNSLLAAHGF